MKPPHTLLALSIGVAIGFSIAVAGGVRASRESGGMDSPTRGSRLFAEVAERVKTDYVEPVDDRRLMELAVRGMVAGLDPHSTLLDATEYAEQQSRVRGHYAGIGIEVAVRDSALRVVAPIEDSPADHAGLHSGDVLVAIDGRELSTVDPAQAVDLLRGPEGSVVRLTVDREGAGEPLPFTVRRGHIAPCSVRDVMLGQGIGYVRIRCFGEATADELGRALARLAGANGGPLRGLVLDLRDNPGGDLDAATAAADLFLDDGVIVSATGRASDARFSVAARPGDALDGASLAVLVNGGSASAAEILAGALHDHGRAVIVGRTTFGKGSVQTLLPLSDGHALKLTTSYYYTPSGASISGRGIRPDIVLARGVMTAPGNAPPPVDRDDEVRAAVVALDHRPRHTGRLQEARP